MMPLESNHWRGEPCVMPRGATLMRRAIPLDYVYRVDVGRVSLQLNDGGLGPRQVGTLMGPCWLNATCAVLGENPLVDAVADTDLRVQRVTLPVFMAEMESLPGTARSVLAGVALAHRQQTELAVSRLTKDAEARCAEWLLRHAETPPDRPGTLQVALRERKRMVAAQLGIAPETFSRVLRQLRERELISGTGRVLGLIDPHGLRQLART